MKHLLGISVFVFLTGSLSQMAISQEKVNAVDLVALFEAMSGNQPGHRKAHAKGVCAEGLFSPKASDAFRGAELFANGDLPVVMRFSMGGGDPNADEREPGTRGMGMQIRLPEGQMHYFTGNNFPVFAGKDPDTFYGFLKSFLPDENGNRDMQKTMAFIQANPSVQPHVAWRKNAGTAFSYANTEFFGLHTFYFDPEDGERTKFRWHLVPDLGIKTLSKDEAAQKQGHFLDAVLADQLSRGMVSFTLNVSLGLPEDTDVDPSIAWPVERETFSIGKVTLTGSGGEECTAINFDPNILSTGFSPSEDPILRIRSAAYAISLGKRLSGQ